MLVLPMGLLLLPLLGLVPRNLLVESFCDPLEQPLRFEEDTGVVEDLDQDLLSQHCEVEYVAFFLESEFFDFADSGFFELLEVVFGVED